MNGYYTEIINEIKEALRENHPAEALFMIRRELSMPYVPPEAEEILKLLKRDAVYHMSEHSEEHEDSVHVLLSRLHGSPAEQLSAADRLSHRNLRDCTEEIRDYLGGSPFPEAAALLIDALASQEVQDEFTIVKDGLEYTFWADAVTPVMKSEGLKEALRFLAVIFAKEPAMLEMARQVMVHQAYMYLPLSYEKEEGEMLARSAVKEVAGAMQRDDLVEEADRVMKQKLFSGRENE